jgi:hypothetical protein
MSKVLERKMFAKQAKKFAKGGEVEQQEPAFDMEAGLMPRSQRERMASELLGRDLGYSLLAQGDRPMFTRPTATGMPQMMAPPQAVPPQMQAAQMQQLAQAGMLPRFQEGGEVKEPSMWSPLTWLKKLYGGNPPLPEGLDRPTPVVDARVNPMSLGFSMSDMPLPPDGGRNLMPSGLPSLSNVLGVPQFSTPSAPNEAQQAAMEADRESRRAAGFSKIAPPEKKAPPPPPPAEKKKDNLQDIKVDREARKAELAAQAQAAREENKWLALMQAGLAIAAGRSPNAITNIGQGGQAGLASFMALEQQRRRDEDAAMRRDIAEREYGLQERRFQAQQPLLAAQAAYWQNRPASELATLQARQMVARTRAAEAARKAWEKKAASPEYMGMNALQKQAAEQLFLKQETDRLYGDELLKFRAGVYGDRQQDAEPTTGE